MATFITLHASDAATSDTVFVPVHPCVCFATIIAKITHQKLAQLGINATVPQEVIEPFRIFINFVKNHLSGFNLIAHINTLCVVQYC